jgi:hypothetical protein
MAVMKSAIDAAGPFLRMSERACRDFVLRLAEHAITGGAAYDALVAATAAAAGAELVNVRPPCDRCLRGVGRTLSPDHVTIHPPFGLNPTPVPAYAPRIPAH